MPLRLLGSKQLLGGMMSSTPAKCAHMACSCTVPAGKKYCSTHCEDAKGMTTLTCHCGHHGCDDKA
jgi:hypothetical protein